MRIICLMGESVPAKHAEEPGSSSGPTREPVAQRIIWTLEACAAGKRALTTPELVEATGLAKTTVHRMGWKLVELGLLEHSREGFSIGTKLFALASANPVINEVRLAAIPYLVELQRSTGAMPDLAILSDGKALVLDGLYTQEHARMPKLVGVALPLHCTAVGKAIAATLDADQREELLLSHRRLPAATKATIVRPSLLRDHLAHIAQCGLAISDEEFISGCKGVAAAFRMRGGATVAIGVVDAWNSPVIPGAARPVLQAAAALERALS